MSPQIPRQGPPLSVRWRPARQWLQSAMSPAWRDWLSDRGSLTERLIKASGNRFSVTLLNQGPRRPLDNEVRALQLQAGRVAVIREVTLYGGDCPWVYARSVLPLETLAGRHRALRHLDNRPLGALLFADPTMSRDAIEIARVPGALIPQGLARGEHWLWGRRSVFYLDGRPLLVAEIFLPGFNPYTVDT